MKSNRIYLREAVETDTAFLIQLMNTQGWIEHIGDRNIKTDLDALAYIQKSLIHSYATNGFGLCLICLNETSKLIGMCGLVKRDTLDLPDLGFAILPEYEGMGYVSEASRLTIDFAENQLKLPEILAITSPTNIRSQNLLERLGFIVVSNNDYESDGETLKKYSLDLSSD
ncbi:MAG: ribosomal-protein-alanine N-acetyltransferase [Crocinitomix sp.]|jgi:ribosomal-protein-alanine N-acetyltransferase